MEDFKIYAQEEAAHIAAGAKDAKAIHKEIAKLVSIAAVQSYFLNLHMEEKAKAEAEADAAAAEKAENDAFYNNMEKAKAEAIIKELKKYL